MRAFHEVRNYDSDFKVWHALYSNISFMAHWHKEIELIYVRRGTLEINITNRRFTAGEGDFIFLDSGEIHNSTSANIDNSVDFILFDSGILSSAYHTSGFLSPLMTKEMLQQYGIEEKCRQLINTVIYELNRRDAYYQEIIKASIQEFWYLLKRKLPRDNQSQLAKNKHLSRLSEFQQLLSYIEAHYQEPLTLKEAADRIHFSESHFSKAFKSLMGMPYVSYVNLVRIENAIILLQKSQTITDAAMNCGFNNIRTFNRVFKQITGRTPSEFLNLEDADSYRFAYSRQKSNEKRIVENDSPMLIKYTRNESIPL